MTPPTRTPRPHAAAAVPPRRGRLRTLLALGLAAGLAAAGLVATENTAGAAAQAALPAGTQFYLCSWPVLCPLGRG